jgi:hypothetical protein
MPSPNPENALSPAMRAVLARLCERLGSLFLTQAVKLPYLVDVLAAQLLGRPIAGGTYETWEHGVVAREVFRFFRYQAEGDPVFRVEPHEYSESGKRISLWGAAPELGTLLPEGLAIVDFAAAEFGGIAPEQLGYLTKRLNTEVPPEAWGTNARAALNEESFLRLSADRRLLCERISEADLDDRSQWGESVNADPKAAFLRALDE